MPPVAANPVMQPIGQTARDAYMRPLQTRRKQRTIPAVRGNARFSQGRRLLVDLFHLIPSGDLADIDALDLVNGQVLDGVLGVDDNGDAVHGQHGCLGAGFGFAVL